ncbi:hypothetical protein KI387_015932, partial [Taxus chinensis]
NLKVQVVMASDLPVRDFRSSDPYVKLTLGSAMKKTRVMSDNLNPVWREDLTFPVKNTDCCLLKVEVWDSDAWGPDDRMGDAEIDLKPLFEKERKQKKLVVSPCKENCLYRDSIIIQRGDGRRVQEVWLKLRK